MTTDAREELRKLVEYFEEKLRPMKRRLAAMDRQAARQARPVSIDSIYADKRPVLVARQILRERGEKIPEDELKNILIEGGITLNKRKGSVDVGFRIAIKAGTLTVEGTNKLVGLPEWLFESILNEYGKPMPKDELIDVLMKRGLAHGNKERVEKVINAAIKADSLTVTGKDELVGLPE
jgi:hypothetical protein